MSTPQDLMNELAAKLMAAPSKAEKLSASFKFVLTGKGGGTWIVQCKKPVTVINGDGPSDCCITLSSEDFVSIYMGTLNPQLAFMQGKLSLSGDITQALKLSELFPD